MTDDEGGWANCLVQLIKEKQSESGKYEGKVEVMESAINQLMATPTYRAPVPRMHIWSTSPALLDTPSDSVPSSYWDKNDAYATPTMKRFVPNFTHDDSPGAQTFFRTFVLLISTFKLYITNTIKLTGSGKASWVPGRCRKRQQQTQGSLLARDGSI